MKNFNKEGIKSDKGFTMIELIIVIAIMGILAAILVPSFTQMTRKSRLKADISTARNVQTQIELYVAEHDGLYPGNSGVEPTAATMQAVIDELVAQEYLKASDVISTAAAPAAGDLLDFQTAGVVISYDAATSHATVDVTPAAVHAKVVTIAATLSDRDQEWLTQ